MMRLFSATRSVLVVLTLLSATTVFADEYIDQVRTNLQSRYDYWHNRGDGWTQLPDLQDIGLVNNGKTTSITYTLVKGNTYKIVGVCDSECSAIDLGLSDDTGKLIASSTANNENPIVEVTPIRDGAFTLKVSMQKCENSLGCNYGVDVYRAR